MVLLAIITAAYLLVRRQVDKQGGLRGKVLANFISFSMSSSIFFKYFFFFLHFPVFFFCSPDDPVKKCYINSIQHLVKIRFILIWQCRSSIYHTTVLFCNLLPLLCSETHDKVGRGYHYHITCCYSDWLHDMVLFKGSFI